jgi:transcriptional regulator with XRE-family HTH domain
MPRTPKRAGRPERGGRFLSEIVTLNVRAYRAMRGLTQEDLAERLAALGHGWVRATVSEVERNGRTIAVDELAGLAAALGVSIARLLTPVAADMRIDVGGRGPLPPAIARPFILDPELDDGRARQIAALAGIPNPINHQEDT